MKYRLKWPLQQTSSNSTPLPPGFPGSLTPSPTGISRIPSVGCGFFSGIIHYYMLMIRVWWNISIAFNSLNNVCPEAISYVCRVSKKHRSISSVLDIIVIRICWLNQNWGCINSSVRRLERVTSSPWSDCWKDTTCGNDVNPLFDFFLNFVIIISHFQEIYPPKISEFAYVTDGACTESEILHQELLMLKVSQLWVISNHGDFHQITMTSKVAPSHF